MTVLPVSAPRLGGSPDPPSEGAFAPVTVTHDTQARPDASETEAGDDCGAVVGVKTNALEAT